MKKKAFHLTMMAIILNSIICGFLTIGYGIENSYTNISMITGLVASVIGIAAYMEEVKKEKEVSLQEESLQD